MAWASPERAFLDTVAAEARLESGDHLLDVGCGTGALLATLASKEPGAVLLGLDPSEDALELASRRLYGSGTRTEFRQGVGHELPFENETFDVVCATLLLQSLPPGILTATIEECRRTLKPGGRLIVADWADRSAGFAGLTELPATLMGRLISGTRPAGRLGEKITRAGFLRAHRVTTFTTFRGVLEVITAAVPPSS